MKRILLLVLSLGLTVFISQRVFVSPCNHPITFKVETVDDKFGLSKDKFLEDSKKAADIWNKAHGKDLLVFNPNGILSVNLIYDERQLLQSQLGSSKGQISNLEGTLDSQIVKYEKDLANFKKNVADLNNQIDMWNQRGGATPEIYNQLIQRQRDLQNEMNKLNAVAKSLNLMTQDLNVQIGVFNKTVDTFNAALEQRPEEGVYFGDRERIEVYFYVTPNELIRTIAHEMGHARGLEHVENQKSIMYEKTNQVLVPTKEDLDELKRVCAERSYFDVVVSRVKTMDLRQFQLLFTNPRK